MTTFTIRSEQPRAGMFHFDIYGGASVGALVVASAVCLLHGEFSVVPALLCLTAMTAVVFGVAPPETGASAGGRGDGAARVRRRRTRLLRRHRLGQSEARGCRNPSGGSSMRMGRG